MSRWMIFWLLAAMTSAVASAPSSAADPVDQQQFGNLEYIGYEGCRMCHRAQYLDWERSAHARAFELLRPGQRISAKRRAELDPDHDYRNEQDCMPCHTTGQGQPGGFVSQRLTPSRVGVGCESCHGPGSHYREVHKAQRSALDPADAIAAGQVYGSRDADVCLRCHEHEDMPFNAGIDDKYIFDHQQRLRDTRSFHRHYR